MNNEQFKIIYDLFGLIVCALLLISWKPRNAPILTSFEEKITPDNVLQEYPRPQMKRDKWKNLNGMWNYSLTDSDKDPMKYNDEILVPFCIESPLSGVQKQITKDQYIWYYKKIALPSNWKGKKILLHFGGVDWETVAQVNGQQVGTHQGAYTPFSFDITDAVKGTGEQEIKVRVNDPKGKIFTLVGKQNRKLEGNKNEIPSYETVGGIWQTVWLEAVNEVYIEGLKITPDIDNETVKIEAKANGNTSGCSLTVTAFDNKKEVASIKSPVNKPITLKISKPKLWTPDSPFLYTLKIKLLKSNKTVDNVESYFGMRKISLKKTANGQRIYLNNKEIFQIGPLDQGYWPGTVLTPPSEEAILFDLEYLKKVGCNMVRLHIKTNPQRWYYHCDRLGLLVWQDFVCSRKKNPTKEEVKTWRTEQKRMIDTLYNHPSIVMWVVFNESWGQHNTEEHTTWAMKYDSSRLISTASGWIDFQDLGHIRDIHDYSIHPSIPVPQSEPKRAVLLGEGGGMNCIVKGNNWSDMGMDEYLKREDNKQKKRKRGGGMLPRKVRDDEWVTDFKRPTYSPGNKFEEHYDAYIDDLRLLQLHGLCGMVYTQLTDMKIEQNGYLTFDRKRSKMNVKTLNKIHNRLFKPKLRPESIIPVSSKAPQKWKYTTDNPGADWYKSEFADSKWKESKGPFGNCEQYTVNTKWVENGLYLRKSFKISDLPKKASLDIHFYGMTGKELLLCEIYLNGRLINDYLTRHKKEELRVASIMLRPEAVKLFKKGKNTLAVKAFFPDSRERLFDIGLNEITVKK